MLNIILRKNEDLYPATNWVLGTFTNRKVVYSFEAKIYSEPSDFGINEGRVSKLRVKNQDLDKVIFSYDRGYDFGKKSRVNYGMLKDLIDFLEKYAVEAWIPPKEF